MKATDLMIGDWVTGKKWIEKPFHLTRITEAFCYGRTASGSVVGPFFFEEIVPIPLTPEILEKNGWKLISNTRNKLEYSWSTGAIEEYADIHIYVGKDHSNIWRWDFPILNIHLYRGDIELTKFRYVHELQHALKLCGIDMEITL